MSALPKLHQKMYSKKILGTKTDYTYRGFTLKEQKELIMVKDTADNYADTYRAMIRMVQSCVDKSIPDVGNLYVAQFEDILYAVKGVAEGNQSKFEYECPHCKSKLVLTIDTEKEMKSTNTNFTKEINLGNKIRAKFTQVRMNDLVDMFSKEYANESERTFDVFTRGLEIVVEDQTIKRRGVDFNDQEAMEFIDTFDTNAIKEISDFYSNMPQLEPTKTFVCDECKKEFTVLKGDMKSFL